MTDAARLTNQKQNEDERGAVASPLNDCHCCAELPRESCPIHGIERWTSAVAEALAASDRFDNDHGYRYDIQHLRILAREVRRLQQNARLRVEYLVEARRLIAELKERDSVSYRETAAFAANALRAHDLLAALAKEADRG